MTSPVTSQEARETAEGGEVGPPFRTTKDAIIARLEERYPDKLIPRGDLKEAAVGFSYQYVRQLARAWKEGTTRKPRRATGVRLFIENEVASKYPCMEVPRGVQSEWAEQWGVSRQRVNGILRDIGARAGKKHRVQRTCMDCDVYPGVGFQRCPEHRSVSLTCQSCGKEFKLPVGEVTTSARQGSNRKFRDALTLCRKDCRKQRGIAFMKANPGVRLQIVAEKFGVSRSAVGNWATYMYYGQIVGRGGQD